MSERAEREALAGRVGRGSCWPMPAETRGAGLVSRDLRDLEGRPRPTRRRPCLRCRTEFDSHGAGNRLCGECGKLAAEASPLAV